MPIRTTIREFGLGQAGAGAAAALLRRWLGLSVWSVHVRPISGDYAMPPGHAARFEFKRLTREDALAASRNPRLDLPETFVRDAFARGDIGVGAFEQGRLVAYAWRTLTRAPVTEGLWLRLHGESIRYGYKLFVLPEYRGLELNASVTRFYDRYFAERGIRWDIEYVDLDNLVAMRRSFSDPTRRRIGFAGYLALGTRYLTFRTPGVRPYLSFERDLDTRPSGGQC